MSFGKNILTIRKKKGISQAELAKMLGTKAPVIGRYERDEMKPSIDVAKKMANILNISLDFLVGNMDFEVDQNALKRIGDISKMTEIEQDKIYMVIDALIRDFKFRKVATNR
jgi:transcriptional regulator with XRE-family HTH domain